MNIIIGEETIDTGDKQVKASDIERISVGSGPFLINLHWKEGKEQDLRGYEDSENKDELIQQIKEFAARNRIPLEDSNE